MRFNRILVLGSASAVLGAVCKTRYRNGLIWGNAIRMNQIQVVGTHNSYHVEPTKEEKVLIDKVWPFVKSLAGVDVNIEDIYYSHAPLETQLKEQRVRAFEFDIFADPSGGNYAEPIITSNLTGLEYKTNATKVLHIPDVDVHTVCTTFIACLKVIKSFLDANPNTLPIPILTEFSKSHEVIAKYGRSKPIPWNNITLLDRLDQEILSVFKRDQLITPDDIRYPNMTLDESIRKYGWPNLDSARGKVLFLMDNEPNDDVTLKYIKGKPSLEGRVLFTNSEPGRPDCAFQKLNDPGTEESVQIIQKQVKANYLVRTMADVALSTVRECNAARRDAAFRSGAQIISTDFPVAGLSQRYGDCAYAAEIGDGKVARCNPVNGRNGCVDKELE